MTHGDSRHIVSGELAPTPPFDFRKSLDFLNIFTPTAGEQSLASQELVKAVRINGQNVAFRIEATGTIDEPRLRYALLSSDSIDSRREAGIVDRIANFLSLSDALGSFYTLAAEYGDYQGYWAHYLRAFGDLQEQQGESLRG